MKTQEILSIIALSLLGLCLLCGLAKMAMKKDSAKKNCDKACSMAIFAAVALVGVSQLLTETEKYESNCGKLCNPVTGDCAKEAAGQDSCGGVGGGSPNLADSGQKRTIGGGWSIFRFADVRRAQNPPRAPHHQLANAACRMSSADSLHNKLIF